MKKQYQKPVVEKEQVRAASSKNCCGMWNACGINNSSNND